MLRLGVNIDHIATVRNARGISHPDPLRAAQIAKKAGADGITAHLREDRRHIRDDDVYRIKSEVALPLNLEMAATYEMLNIALDVKPNACCLVPEKREELTTEGGLNAADNVEYLSTYSKALQEAGIRVSLFLDPDISQINAAKAIGADIVELHTGGYCETNPNTQTKELNRLIKSAQHITKTGIECHAGHGLSYHTVKAVAEIPEITELNIGHFLIGESMFVGLEAAIKHMRHLMDQARQL